MVAHPSKIIHAYLSIGNTGKILRFVNIPCVLPGRTEFPLLTKLDMRGLKVYTVNAINLSRFMDCSRENSRNAPIIVKEEQKRR